MELALGTKIQARLIAIHRNAQENLDERGLDTLWVTIGVATWKADDGGRDPEAPVLLFKASLERAERGKELRLTWTGDAEVNRSLVHVMTNQCRIKGMNELAEELNAALEDQGEDAPEAVDASALLGRFSELADEVEGFRLEDRLFLGNFAFHKLALVQDLQDNEDALLEHDFIAALCGDPEAKEILRSRISPFPKEELDSIHPEEDFTFLPADASQMVVIRNVLSGQDGVIQGPPGTGKSQTIANLIGELAARGLKVLFVAEKAAAIEVVKERLAGTGLEHMVLDLHGTKNRKKEVAEQLRRGLDSIRTAAVVGNHQDLGRLAEHRNRLTDHVKRLHGQVRPWEISPFQAMGQLLDIPDRLRTETRWRGQVLTGLSGPVVMEVEDRLREASTDNDLFLHQSASAWNGANVADGAAVDRALDAVEGALETEEGLGLAVKELSAHAGFRAPQSMEEASILLDLARHTNGLLAEITPIAFGLDLGSRIDGLASARKGTVGRAWAWITNAEYRHAIVEARQICNERKVRPFEALRVLESANGCIQGWRTYQGPVARMPSGPLSIGPVVKSFDALEGHLKLLDTLLPSPLRAMSFDALEGSLRQLRSDQDVLHRIPKLLEIERRLWECGVSPLIQEMAKRNIAPKEWTTYFRSAWALSLVAHFRVSMPDLGNFDGRNHEWTIGEFRKLEYQREINAAGRIRRAYAERAIQAMNQHPDQADAVRAEVARKRPRSLRTLLGLAPDVLLSVWPCWMASPLSVAQLLPPKAQFDVVIFDEASQIGPEDAISSILRAKRVVVAGDTQQLPPSPFFADGLDEELLKEMATSGYESLLHTVNGLLPRSGLGDEGGWFLEWHYRSKDESLIAFSNHEIYQDRLITFPQPHDDGAVGFVHVDPGATSDYQQESVGSEVHRVVSMVVEHARERPHETLGVIALGTSHARRIQLALDDEAERNPVLAEYLRDYGREGFFVKNLERVQGDERDAIILSIGYGQDRTGTLSHNFGPINQEGGERRLNVAITRARRRMTTVASFRPEDINPGKTSGKGPDLLRKYLLYAASGGRAMPDRGPLDQAENSFELDIRMALESKGLHLIPQFGVSSYRIDLAVQHPQRPGRYVLAIECDGASYHSAPSARDRDRLRQQHLEAMGWKFLRIWSTDWFQRRDEEIDRILHTYEEAVLLDDQGDIWIPRPATQTQVTPLIPTQCRNPRPYMGPKRESISAYSDADLISLAGWAMSDGLLRTDDELVDELASELGFRRGSRVVAQLRTAITIAKQRTSAPRRGAP